MLTLSYTIINILIKAGFRLGDLYRNRTVPVESLVPSRIAGLHREETVYTYNGNGAALLVPFPTWCTASAPTRERYPAEHCTFRGPRWSNGGHQGP